MLKYGHITIEKRPNSNNNVWCILFIFIFNLITVYDNEKVKRSILIEKYSIQMSFYESFIIRVRNKNPKFTPFVKNNKTNHRLHSKLILFCFQVF